MVKIPTYVIVMAGNQKIVRLMIFTYSFSTLFSHYMIKKISQPNTQVSKKINPTILQSSCISVIIK